MSNMRVSMSPSRAVCVPCPSTATRRIARMLCRQVVLMGVSPPVGPWLLLCGNCHWPHVSLVIGSTCWVGSLGDLSGLIGACDEQS